MSGQAENLPKRRPDRAALVVAGLLAAVAIWIAYSMTGLGARGAYARVGPTTFPYVIAGVLFLLAVWTVVEAVRGDFPEREPQDWPPVLWIVGGLVAQMLLLKVVGFSIATGLLFAATARGFGRGPLWMTVPIGIVLSLAIWFLFAVGLQLSLPAGPLERLIS
ncbi:MAG: tripartite tricarboxylate transporter TctB family protein [Mesorhizobium sp.]|nr:tripartite tricarboxylate transporter TctB family protein [Mesorhizobium sp.]MBL8579841.1 tripartite tricarboxylate transporter TctB family protein [Mesorhizobium sp.]